MKNKIVNPFSNIPAQNTDVVVDQKDEVFRSASIGFGSKVFRADQSGIWLGASKFSDAPFSVDMEGNATIASITLSGYFELGVDDLDDIDDGSTHGKTTFNEVTGGSRAYSGLNSNYEIIEGFVNSQLSGKSLPSQGIRIDANGIYGRKLISGTPTTTFYISTTGDAYFYGTVASSSLVSCTLSTGIVTASTIAGNTITGGTISGTTITGTTLQTGTSGENVNITSSRINVRNGSTITGTLRGYTTYGGNLGSKLEVTSAQMIGTYATLSMYSSSILGFNLIASGTYPYLRLKATSILLDCPTSVNGNLIPDIGSYDLGISSARWSTVYGNTLDISDKVYVDSTMLDRDELAFRNVDSWIKTGRGGTLTSNFKMTSSYNYSYKHFLPFTNNIYDNGTNTKKWRAGYYGICTIGTGGIEPTASKAYDLGADGVNQWDNVYADDFINQCSWLDNEDDVGLLKGIKPLKDKSGNFILRDGKPRIDYETLPDFVRTNYKYRFRSKAERRNKFGNEEIPKLSTGYSIGKMLDLTVGAVRQLDARIEALEKQTINNK